MSLHFDLPQRNVARLLLIVAAAAFISASCGGDKSSLAPQSLTDAPAAITKIQGDAQEGAVGVGLVVALVVRVDDQQGRALRGQQVTFTVSKGDGSVSASPVTTGPDGRAQTIWTLGSSTTSGQEVTASVGQGLTQTFTATARAAAPANIAIHAGADQTVAAGFPIPVMPAARVTDRFGNPVAGADVDFSLVPGSGTLTASKAATDANGVAVVGGWTVSNSVGKKTLTATVPPFEVGSALFVVTVTTGPPAMAAAHTITQQSAVIGAQVSTPPVVRVSDAFGNPAQGVPVTFEITAGEGSATGLTTATDASGLARVDSWTLGHGENRMVATVGAPDVTGSPVTFVAVGTSPSQFNITVRFLTPLTATQEEAFARAARRWEQVIVGDLQAVQLTRSAGTCANTPHPAINEVVDDVLIFATAEPIDGVGKTLGSAGPCVARLGGGLPVLGAMLFDSADLLNLENSGLLEAVILHEMGHVLGIGIPFYWGQFLRNPSLPSSPGVDTHFDAPKAVAAFNEIGGNGFALGKVPVENAEHYGAGSRDSHWREAVMSNELMTPTINSGANRLSLVTARSLQDIGYVINHLAVDQFSLGFGLAGQAAAAAERGAVSVELHNDVAHGPIEIVDPFGRVVRIVHPPKH